MSFLNINVLENASNNSPFSAEDFLNKLFPNIWSFLINFLALVVLFIAVYFLAFKKIKKLVEARRNYVESNLRDSEKAKAKSEEKIAEAEKMVVEASVKADEIIDKAKSDAVIKADEIIAEAEEEAKKRQEDADVAIRQAEEKSKAAMKEAIVEIALDASKQVLAREVSEEDNRKLVDEFVESVSDGGDE